MFRILFVLFILIPIIEIAVFIQVGDIIGLWPTIGIVIITAWLGAKNVRQQGVATLQSAQTKMAQGQMPSDDIVAGILIMLAGILLLTPGFVTDTFGLLLLIPTFRSRLIDTVQQQLQKQQNSNVHFHFEQGNTYQHEEYDVDITPQHSNIDQKGLNKPTRTIDGEFERKE